MNDHPLHAVDQHLRAAADSSPAYAHPLTADAFPAYAHPVVHTVSVVRVTVAAHRPGQVVAVTLPAALLPRPAGPVDLPADLAPRPAAGHLRAVPAPAGPEDADPDRGAAGARARAVARAVEHEAGTHPDVRAVWADGDTVRVLLGLRPPFDRWDAWCAYFGITAVGEQPGTGGPAGEGLRDGVPVTVFVRGPDDTPHRDERTYRYGDVTYDLELPHRDAHGETWYFQGLRTPDGMPLLSVDGRPERCSLANVAEYAGPLTPVRATLPAAEGDR
ncbi:BN159_2729 family protein [Streptomyces sp. NPDC101219]|uniref:BN159_2729 family protein n=1 Tax=Streptomyces sp. NPDC101219 TaxID=3366131 RepID=UPI00380D350D